jgi:hypothetical protein
MIIMFNRIFANLFANALPRNDDMPILSKHNTNL